MKDDISMTKCASQILNPRVAISDQTDATIVKTDGTQLVSDTGEYYKVNVIKEIGDIDGLNHIENGIMNLKSESGTVNEVFSDNHTVEKEYNMGVYETLWQKYMEENLRRLNTDDEGIMWMCNVCGKIRKRKGHIKKHLSMHFNALSNIINF